MNTRTGLHKEVVYMTCKVSVLNEIVKQYPKLTILEFMELLFKSKVEK